MYVSPWMQAALLPARWNVCGAICPPLSLWARYILRTSGNAYFLPGSEPNIDSAAEVLIYATRSHVEGARLYWNYRARMRAMKKAHRLLKKREWTFVDRAVAEYVFECQRCPSHKQIIGSTLKNDPVPQPACAPLEWVLVEYMSKGNPARVEAAWNSPYVVAMCMFDAGRDIRGEDNSLITEQREQELDEMEEKIAASADAERKGA